MQAGFEIWIAEKEDNFGWCRNETSSKLREVELIVYCSTIIVMQVFPKC